MDGRRVVVIGGGMVGGALAADLGRRGIPVRVLESDPPTRPTASQPPRLRVAALNRRSIEYLETLGAWQSMNTERVADFDQLSTWDIAGGGRLRFHAEEIGLERLGVFVENEHLQAALIETASEYACVQIDAPAAALSITSEPSGVALSLEGEGRLDPALIVAADGARSRVRSAAGIRVNAGDYQQHAVVASVTPSPPAGRQTWQRFTPEGPQALLPLANGAASLVWYVSPDRASTLLALPEDEFVHAFEQAFPTELGAIAQLHGRGGFPIRWLHAQRYWRANVALVGDSAHVIHPLAGQGVNLGLRDAQALAGHIAQAYDQGLPLAHARGLAAYERSRRADNHRMQSIMTAFHKGFTAPLGPLAAARGWGLALAQRGGWLKRRVLRYALDGR